MEILGGPLFAVAGAGESHGPAVTTIVFGCPAGLEIERDRIQFFLDRRRPGSSKHGTPRREDDTVFLTGGLYRTERLLDGPSIRLSVADPDTPALETYSGGFTTGEPLSALVFSRSRKSAHYDQLQGLQGAVRPGHADLVKYHKSRGFTDVRGGGRSSYRSTISDVIGGSVARLYLQRKFGTVIVSSICQVGALKSDQSLLDRFAIGRGRIPAEGIAKLEQELADNELHACSAEFASAAGRLIRDTRVRGDSLGAGIEVVALNPPPLIGEPLYQSLKLRLMGSLGGLHAVQSCEMGSGWASVGRRGSEHNDPIRARGYQGNHHGGLLGGVTTGGPLSFRVGFKPTSSIALPQQSVTKGLDEIDFQLQQGRHDPCVGVRAGITLESRMAIELMNAVLMHQAGDADTDRFRLFPEG
ncbi:MAG: chorismate synthase [Caldilineaceae bacterium]|nr:chorismate synthase [Caldilineaceae bacterium]